MDTIFIGVHDPVRQMSYSAEVPVKSTETKKEAAPTPLAQADAPTVSKQNNSWRTFLFGSWKMPAGLIACGSDAFDNPSGDQIGQDGGLVVTPDGGIDPFDRQVEAGADGWVDPEGLCDGEECEDPAVEALLPQNEIVRITDFRWVESPDQELDVFLTGFNLQDYNDLTVYVYSNPQLVNEQMPCRQGAFPYNISEGKGYVFDESSGTFEYSESETGFRYNPDAEMPWLPVYWSYHLLDDLEGAVDDVVMTYAVGEEQLIGARCADGSDGEPIAINIPRDAFRQSATFRARIAFRLGLNASASEMNQDFDYRLEFAVEGR